MMDTQMSSLVSRPFLHMGESLEMKLTDVFSSVSPWHQFNPPPDLSSWSVRHCAILGLSRVCRTCRKLPMKDGMSNVSWSKLMQRHSIEKDNRVLEAYKLSQVCCTSVGIYTYSLYQSLMLTRTFCTLGLFADLVQRLAQCTKYAWKA